MDITLVGLFRNLLPGVPRFLLTALQASFGISPNALHQDALTELVRLIARPVLGTPSSLLQSQENSRRDYGVWGPMWIAKCTLPRPEIHSVGSESSLGIEQALVKAIEYLGGAAYEGKFPEIVDVEAEWTGYREGVSYLARRPDMPEYEQYRKLMQEVEPESPTILYFHGGAFWCVTVLPLPFGHQTNTSQPHGSSNPPYHDIKLGKAQRWPLSICPVPPSSTACLSICSS
jgi:hypothetical protein